MKAYLLPLTFFAGECLAHPGHGARQIHAHGWDWGQLALGLAMLAVAAAVVYWRSK
jgi:hypothetical protein